MNIKKYFRHLKYSGLFLLGSFMYSNAFAQHETDFNIPFIQDTVQIPYYKNPLFNTTAIYTKRELRCAWIATVYNIDYPSNTGLSVNTLKSEFINLITKLKSAGINAVFFQVRPSCDAFYNSPYEPWSQWLSGTQGVAPAGGFDPLVFMIDEAHKRGIEFHAWLNPYRAVVSTSSSSIASTHISVTQPSWCVTYNTIKILNPGLPQVRNYVTTIVKDIVSRYNVDGIHFDDYFYPYPSGGTVFDDDATFAAYPRGFTNKADWRRDNVNLLIKMVNDSIKSIKSYVKFGVGPFGIWKNGVPSGISGLSSYDEIYCDPIAWLNNQSIDYVSPQLYWKIGTNQDFNTLVNWWGTQAQNNGRHCYAGTASYNLNPSGANWAINDILNQITSTRTINSKAQGNVFFSSTSIKNNMKSFYDSLNLSFNKYKCLIPSMPWLDAIAPLPPANATYTLTPNTVTLNWQKPLAASDGDTARYFVIYRNITGGAVNTSDPKQILFVSPDPITTYTDSIIISSVPGLAYAITTCDKLHNESSVVYINVNTTIYNPGTIVSTSGMWQTQNFISTFIDSCGTGATGISQKYHQALELNNSNWKGNTNNGFLSETFTSSLSPDWIPVDATWNTSGGVLEQSSTASSNTNIYTPITQDSTHSFLFHWQMMFNPGSNRRAGIYIFCSDPTQTQRGNAYMIWFRADDDKCQLYTVKNNSISTNLTNDNCTIDDGVWYDCKATYDPTTGVLKAYLNNQLISTYTDPNPLKTGNYISLRTGNAIVKYDDIKVWKSRNNNALISIGPAVSNDIRYQNPDSATAAGKIESLIIDNSESFSSIDSKLINIDWTVPSSVTLSDGTGMDTDTSYSLTSLSANWTASIDLNSGIAKYWYAIGTSAGATDVVNWTNNNYSKTVTINGLNLTNGQTYYFSVKAENGAGLQSAVVSSDGITIANAPLADFIINTNTICEGTTINFTNQSQFASAYLWSFDGGTPSTSTAINPSVVFNSAGQHTITLTAFGAFGSNTSTFIATVLPNAEASFSANNTTLTLPNAFVIFTNISSNASSYLWDFGNGLSSTDTNPWISYTSPGDYAVTLIAYSSQCANDTLQMLNYIHVQQFVDLTEFDISTMISVTPNPAKEIAFIEFYTQNEEDLQIILYDGIGRNINIYKGKSTSGVNKFELNFKRLSLPQGIYQLMVEKKGTKHLTKIIVY